MTQSTDTTDPSIPPKGFPNFLVIGASKSGTSSLYYYLKQHPQIFLSSVKETQFFNMDKIFNLGAKEFVNIYFPTAENYIAIGDITPSYLVRPQKVIPRIQQVYGNCPPKIVIIMRHPVKRAWSHYQHMVRSGEETETFSQALANEKSRIQCDPDGWWGYRSEGDYAHYIESWMQEIPKENFHFIVTEELAEQPNQVLADLFRHLGVDESFQVPDLAIRNSGGAIRYQWLTHYLGAQGILKSALKSLLPYRVRQKLKTRIIGLNTKEPTSKTYMPDHIQQELTTYYTPKIQQLEKLLNRDLSAWDVNNNLNNDH